MTLKEKKENEERKANNKRLGKGEENTIPIDERQPVPAKEIKKGKRKSP